MKSFLAGSRFALLLTVLMALPAAAADKALNVSLFTPISLAKADDAVTAFRLNLIYGRNTAVKVVDLGLVNHTTTGLSNGLQWGAINVDEGNFKGIQLGGINYNKGTAAGLSWGAVNYAGTAGGLQLAVVNYAESIKGVQIGAINIIKKGGFLPVMIIANWGKE